VLKTGAPVERWTLSLVPYSATQYNDFECASYSFNPLPKNLNQVKTCFGQSLFKEPAIISSIIPGL
jgi:hypothetical protein